MLGLWLQVAIIYANIQDQSGGKLVYAGFILSVTALIITPFQLVLAGFSIRHESRAGQAAAIVIFLADGILIVFEVIAIRSPLALHFVGPYWVTRITIYAALALPLLISSIAMGVYCALKFNKGLKPHLRRKPRDVNPRGASGRHSRQEDWYPFGALTARLEIE